MFQDRIRTGKNVDTEKRTLMNVVKNIDNLKLKDKNGSTLLPNEMNTVSGNSMYIK